MLEQNEALTDTPIPSFYRELDRRYPGAKFILTVRDMESWLLSCKRQFTAKLAGEAKRCTQPPVRRLVRHGGL
ncbi:MAG: hypothetical protein IPQ21_19985 [Betaproteobacteria bacterium]|nr:hypothetical protein [Betaproteobacteria bacterium]